MIANWPALNRIELIHVGDLQWLNCTYELRLPVYRDIKKFVQFGENKNSAKKLLIFVLGNKIFSGVPSQ